MKRYTGQQALYEAISRTKAKSQRRNILERLLPNDAKVEKAKKVEPPSAPPVPVPSPVEEEPQPTPPVVEEPVKVVRPPMTRVVTEKPLAASKPLVPAPRPVVPVEAPEPPRPTQTWLRPKAVQVHDGRIEVSVPYTVGVTAVLAAVLLVLAAFRLGQYWPASAAATPAASAPAKSPEPKVQPSVPPIMREAPTPRVESARPEVSPGAGNASVAPAAASATQGDGNNWIVLTHYAKEADLQFVVKHFADHGIELAVVSLPAVREALAQRGLSTAALPSGDGFLLVTKDTFDNPRREGSNGYRMVQEIARVGALYKGKAPQGYESFGPRYFNDAFGMKIR